MMDTSPESFCRLTKSLSRAGTTRRIPCGRTTCRRVCPADRPSERAAARWLGCTDSIPARSTSATYAEYERISATPPRTAKSVGMPCSRRPGTPRPTISSTRISGRPRKRSTYTVAIARSGQKTGPRRVRRTATSRPKARMNTEQTRNSLMFSSSPAATSGRAARASARLKNASRTRGQPGADVTAVERTPATAIVLSAAIIADRRTRTCSLQDGCAGRVRQPLLLQLLQGAVGPQGVDGLRDAGGQRAALLEQQAELLLGPARRRQ